MAQRPPPGIKTFVTSGRPAGAPRAGGGENRRPETMTAEERAAAQRGLADVRAGRFATDDEVEAAYRRFRP